MVTNDVKGIDIWWKASAGTLINSSLYLYCLVVEYMGNASSESTFRFSKVWGLVAWGHELPLVTFFLFEAIFSLLFYFLLGWTTFNVVLLDFQFYFPSFKCPCHLGKFVSIYSCMGLENRPLLILEVVWDILFPFICICSQN